MGSVFDVLGSSEFDDWEGQFECTSRGCNEWVPRARYHKKTKLLVWKCSKEHVSSMEWNE
jgi:hypothetical protein